MHELLSSCARARTHKCIRFADLIPTRDRRGVVEALLEMEGEERTCESGTQECPGEYNRGVCEADGRVYEEIGAVAGHLGLVDDPFLPAAGDFFLIAKSQLHLLGGYHQVKNYFTRI